MTPLRLAFVPLLDAAPAIIAREMGFAGEEGIALDLTRAPSWSSVRDMLAFGQVEAAHMLSPVPVAMALGIGGVASPISALMVMSLNGTVIGVGNALAQKLKDAGHGFDFDDATAAGNALVAASKGARLRIGVPFPFSMHAELLYVWLSASGLVAPQMAEIRTVPPPMMADALAAGDIDAFCVGEPWGSLAVENGASSLLLPGRSIWTAAPEKVLAVRSQWAADEPVLAARLMKALYKAARWLSEDGSHTALAEILSRPEYLNLPPDIIDRGLTGRIVINARGDTRACPGFINFFAGAATFPWRSQAAWIGTQLARRLGMDAREAITTSRTVFRSDLYRDNLRDIGAILPGASEKLEGGIIADMPVASQTGRLFLPENRFFDGSIFDPSQI